jgi:hypothetical protein
MDEDENIKIAAEVIELLRSRGVDVTSPYDVENWVEEYLTNHSNLFKTGQFKME